MFNARFERLAEEAVAKKKSERTNRIQKLIEANGKLTDGMNGEEGESSSSKLVGTDRRAKNTGQNYGQSSFQQFLTRGQHKAAQLRPARNLVTLVSLLMVSGKYLITALKSRTMSSNLRHLFLFCIILQQLRLMNLLRPVNTIVNEIRCFERHTSATSSTIEPA